MRPVFRPNCADHPFALNAHKAPMGRRAGMDGMEAAAAAAGALFFRRQRRPSIPERPATGESNSAGTKWGFSRRTSTQPSLDLLTIFPCRVPPNG